MPKRLTLLHHILSAQKLIPADPLHIPPEIVNEHVCLPAPALLAPGQHARRENGRDPTRRVRPVSSRPIDQDHVPVHLVHVVRKVINSELALGEKQILNRPALVSDLLLGDFDQLGHFSSLGGVLDVVGVDFRVLLLDVGGVVAVLVDEDGPAVVVQRLPQKGLVGEPENQEIAWGRAFS